MPCRATTKARAKSVSSVLSGVPIAIIPDYWPVASGLLDRAVSYSGGRYELADIFDALMSGKMQLCSAGGDDGKPHVVAVTEIVNYPHKRVANISMLAGEGRDRWLHHLESVEKWARDNDCEAIELRGRAGWERVLKDWDLRQIILEKEL